MIALLARSSPDHDDLLVRTPRSCLRQAGLVSSLHACLGLFASTRRVWTPDHFPLPSLVAQFVPDLELHWEHPSSAQWLGRRHARKRRLGGLGLLALLLFAFRHLGNRESFDAGPAMPDTGVGHAIACSRSRSDWLIWSPRHQRLFDPCPCAGETSMRWTAPFLLVLALLSLGCARGDWTSQTLTLVDVTG